MARVAIFRQGAQCMRTLFLKPQATLDLLEIWNHLAEENFDAAVRFNLQIDADLEVLRQSPGLGHFRRDLTTKDVRFGPSSHGSSSTDSTTNKLPSSESFME
jgi:plasmid stabilization system protein ParE